MAPFYGGHEGLCEACEKPDDESYVHGFESRLNRPEILPELPTNTKQPLKEGFLMTQKIRAWVKHQNTYAWILVAGIFGAFDAIAPGPMIDHAVGLVIVVAAMAAWQWS